LGVGNIQADRVDALAVFDDEVLELRWLAGGGGDEVAGVEGGSDEGTAQAS
jgi:hypothetical protein